MISNLSSERPSVIQFENANEGRTYPFSDLATLVSDEGLQLPDSLVTDLHIIAPHGCTAFLSSVHLSKGIVSACFRILSVEKELRAFENKFDFCLIRRLIEADSLKMTKAAFNELLGKLKDLQYSTRSADGLSVVVKASDFESYRPYRLEQLSGSEDIGGIVTFGNIEFPERPVTYRFLQNFVPITESAMARYEPARLRKLIDPRTGESVSGDVRLDFSAAVDASVDPDGRIRLSLQDAAREGLLSDCDRNRPKNACGATPISSINGTAPDADKRIVIWFH